MIVARFEDSARYALMHSQFRKVFELAASKEIQALPPGRHDIDGDSLFVVVVKGNADGHKDDFLEAHRDYIDVQCTVSGKEEIGWKHLSQTSKVKKPYETSDDAVLFAEAPTFWVDAAPGTAVILYPEDAHAPMQGTGPVHKLVFKVKI